MIVTLARMRLAVWRRTPNAMRWVGLTVGGLLAIGTFLLAANPANPTDVISLFLALIFAGWLLGWIVGPIQSGGSDFLRPEWFAMIPLRPRELARGLLVAGCVGIGVAITLVASAALVLHGLRLSPAAVLVGVPAALLQVLMMLAISRVVAESLGAAAKSRVVLEVTSAQYGLFIAFMFFGWFLLDRLEGLGAGVVDTIPAGVRMLLYGLPSGWGVVAVDAAGTGSWLLAFGALAGLSLLTWLAVIRWAQLLRRRTTEPTVGGIARPRVSDRRVLPATPLGAVAGKDLRTWWRDPRRGVEIRSTLWAAVFISAGLWLFEPSLAVFAGVIAVLVGAMASVNVYGMDGTALWQILLTPGAESSDVRGRQVAWVIIFLPASVVLTLFGLVFADSGWAVPWVLALLPAMLGSAAGLIPLLSVVWLVPETDAHKRSGNPAETGNDAVGLYFAMLFSVPILTLPTGLVLALSVIREDPALAWVAVAVGVVTGFAYVWGLGALAIQRLRSQGPEMLLKMKVGPQPASESKDETELSTGQSWLVGGLMTVGMISLFPQGIVALVMVIVDSTDDPSWFVAHQMPPALQIPVAIGFILIGLVLSWLVLLIYRRATPE